MKIRTSFYVQLGIFVISLVIGVYYALILPGRVPTHWDIHGQADQYGGKWFAICFGPCMILFDLLLMFVLPRISPKNFEIEQFYNTFAYAMVLMSALMLYLSIMILRATQLAPIDLNRGMMAGLFIFFALLGNVLGKVRRNFFIGVRIPWTIASEPTWDATHRLAGRLWFVGGLIGAVLALMGVPMAVSITFLLVIALYPVLASYFIYQKLG